MKISVIIPVYNADKYLRKAVESALQFEEIKEVILVEDNSPDNSLSVCKELILKDKRIRLYQHPNNKNKGAGASRNLGLKNCTQEYIAFLDADDYFLPNRFEKDREVFNSIEKADGVYNAIGVTYYSNEAKQKFTEHFSITHSKTHLTTLNTEVAAERLFKVLLNFENKNAGYFSLDGLTIKRASLDKLKGGWFNEKLKLHQDTEFLWRLAYYVKLYPGNIYSATANRGVHEDNRITANHTNTLMRFRNRFYMFKSLYLWGVKYKVDPEILVYIRSQLIHTDVFKNKGLKMLFTFCKHIVITKGFLTKENYKQTRSDMSSIIMNKLHLSKHI